MGKLGGRELNYASDVDVMFVTAGHNGDSVAREMLRIARGCFRVDVDLRPEGRSGPLTRSLDAYRSYWEKRADAWEFQALLKARPVAGDRDLGEGFAVAAAAATWSRTFSADELAELRSMKARCRVRRLAWLSRRSRDQTEPGRHPRRGVLRAAPPAGPRSSRPRHPGPVHPGGADRADHRGLRVR